MEAINRFWVGSQCQCQCQCQCHQCQSNPSVTITVTAAVTGAAAAAAAASSSEVVGLGFLKDQLRSEVRFGFAVPVLLWKRWKSQANWVWMSAQGRACRAVSRHLPQRRRRRSSSSQVIIIIIGVIIIINGEEGQREPDQVKKPGLAHPPTVRLSVRLPLPPPAGMDAARCKGPQTVRSD